MIRLLRMIINRSLKELMNPKGSKRRRNVPRYSEIGSSPFSILVSKKLTRKIRVFLSCGSTITFQCIIPHLVLFRELTWLPISCFIRFCSLAKKKWAENLATISLIRWIIFLSTNNKLTRLCPLSSLVFLMFSSGSLTRQWY